MDLTIDMQTKMDVVQQRNVTNPAVKLNGAPLTADEYNKVNDMLIDFCNKNNDSIMALKAYILAHLPNFTKLIVSDTGTIETLTSDNGVLTIDLYEHFKNMSLELRDTTTLLLEDITNLQDAINAEILARETDIEHCVDADAYAVDQLTKVNKESPVVTGALSQNRKAGSEVGINSTTLNENNTATAEASSAQGVGTIANSYAQSVRGKYNKADASGEFAEIVGAGSSDTTRRNISELDWSGNLRVAGTVQSKNTMTNVLSHDLLDSNLAGVQCWVHDDGTCTITPCTVGDTAVYFNLFSADKIEYIHHGKKLIGCPPGGSEDTYCMQVNYFQDAECKETVYDTGEGVVLSSNITYNLIEIRIVVAADTIITESCKFKPMITTDMVATYDDYTPYTGASEHLNDVVAEHTLLLSGLNIRTTMLESATALKGNRELLWTGDTGVGNSIYLDTTKYDSYELLLNTGTTIKAYLDRNYAPNKLQGAGGAVLFDSTKYIPGVAIFVADAYTEHLWVHTCAERLFDGTNFNRSVMRIWGIK